jgi:PIN domain nuclease of toxin-antitoxin system
VRINGDPFDEVIVATALTLGLPLITKDVAITDSQLIEVIW